VLFLSVLTPVGEEFLFRGVVANALLRYGPVVGVIAAELMRRSGSVWPAVAVHVVNNLALPLYVLLTGATGPG
jgi:membrane protease YdiL (CAAX protease family)